MRYVFTGLESFPWLQPDWETAIQTIKSNDFDCLIFKVADGTIKWSTNIDMVISLCKSYGITGIPYTYCYGDTFQSLDQEMIIAQGLLARYGAVVLDLE